MTRMTDRIKSFAARHGRIWNTILFLFILLLAFSFRTYHYNTSVQILNSIIGDVQPKDRVNHSFFERFLPLRHNNFSLLVAVYATVSIDMVRGLDTAGIYYPEARALVPSCRFSDLADKHGQYFLESSVILPLAKVIVNQVPGSEILRQHTPLATRLDDIEYGVKYLTERIFTFTVSKFYVRNNHLPLLISDVGWIRCHNFEVLESLYKVTNNHPINVLIFNYLTNNVINNNHRFLTLNLNQS